MVSSIQKKRIEKVMRKMKNNRGRAMSRHMIKEGNGRNVVRVTNYGKGMHGGRETKPRNMKGNPLSMNSRSRMMPLALRRKTMKKVIAPVARNSTRKVLTMNKNESMRRMTKLWKNNNPNNTNNIRVNNIKPKKRCSVCSKKMSLAPKNNAWF